SLARPGGNLTGINVFSLELVAKRLELLRELVPRAIRIAVLVDPANAAGTESTLRGVEAAARDPTPSSLGPARSCKTGVRMLGLMVRDKLLVAADEVIE